MRVRTISSAGPIDAGQGPAPAQMDVHDQGCRLSVGSPNSVQLMTRSGITW